MRHISLEQVLKELRQAQGNRTAREFAAELGITPGYLSDIYRGNRLPGPAALKCLRMERNDTTYRRVDP